MLHKHRQQTHFSGGEWVKTKTIQKCYDLHGTMAIVSQIVGKSFVQTLFSKRYLKEKTFTISIYELQYDLSLLSLRKYIEFTSSEYLLYFRGEGKKKSCPGIAIGGF